MVLEVPCLLVVLNVCPTSLMFLDNVLLTLLNLTIAVTYSTVNIVFRMNIVENVHLGILSSLMLEDNAGKTIHLSHTVP